MLTDATRQALRRSAAAFVVRRRARGQDSVTISQEIASAAARAARASGLEPSDQEAVRGVIREAVEEELAGWPCGVRS